MCWAVQGRVVQGLAVQGRGTQFRVFRFLFWSFSCEQSTVSHCMYRPQTLCQHITHDVTRSRVTHVKLNCVPETFSHSISCFASCLTTCIVHPALCPLFHKLDCWMMPVEFKMQSPSQMCGSTRSALQRNVQNMEQHAVLPMATIDLKENRSTGQNERCGEHPRGTQRRHGKTN